VDDDDDDVLWLTAEELTTWMVMVKLMMRLPTALERELIDDSGVSHFEYGVLSALSNAPDRTLQMSALAAFAHGSLSRLSHAVKRMEDRGWVQRAPSSVDGRLTEATLTAIGSDKLNSASPGHVAKVRELVFDVLSPVQQRQLRAIGERILRQLDRDGSPPVTLGDHPRFDSLLEAQVLIEDR
jgi:DNA-binding MarR family transcriptional regulator